MKFVFHVHRCAVGAHPRTDLARIGVRRISHLVACSINLIVGYVAKPVVAYEKTPTRFYVSSFGMSVIRSINWALSDPDGISMKTFV